MERSMTIHEHQAIPIPQVEAREPIPAAKLCASLAQRPVPPVILAEMARPMINHRGPEFAAIVRRVTGTPAIFFPDLFTSI
jgi:hypothetical protein